MRLAMTTKQQPGRSVDWLSEAFLADPYPYYRELRESDPVHYDQARSVWILTRYDDVVRVLRDDSLFSAEHGLSGSMLVSNPPDHTRLRTLVSKAFTPRTVSQLTARVEELVDGLLDAVADDGGMEVISQFAYPLPITVIAELLGVEPERRGFFRAASEKIAVALGPITDPEVARRATEGRDDLIGYFNELIPQRTADPRDDLLSALVQAEHHGDMLNRDELLAMLLLLLVGGHETTVNLIGNGLLAVLRHPQQLALLRRDVGGESRAVEELLRYDSPVQYSGRLAREDLDIGGKRIEAGQSVRAIVAAANRDPEVFADPEGLDLTRDPNPQVAFGSGIHFCLGAPLARLEGAIALAALVRRLPNLRLAGDELRWRPAAVLRGLVALPVTF
jgi:pimeloyl-[acyl-carrier protein] synthase